MCFPLELSLPSPDASCHIAFWGEVQRSMPPSLALPPSLFLTAATPSPRASAELPCGALGLGTGNPGPSPQSPGLTPASPGDSEVVDVSAQAGGPLWGYGEGSSLGQAFKRVKEGERRFHGPTA